jgi:hypothetical protein
VAESPRLSFQKRHKLALQGLAFGIMMFAPIGLYLAAQVGSSTGIVFLLVALGCGMSLAAWVG